MVGVTAQRILERRIQPPARERQAISVRPRAQRGIPGKMAHLLAHPLEQRGEVDGGGLDIELKRLPGAEL